MTEPQLKDGIKPTEENQQKPVIKTGDNRIRICRDGRITIPPHAMLFNMPMYYRVISVEREGSRLRIELEILKEGAKENNEVKKE